MAQWLWSRSLLWLGVLATEAKSLGYLGSGSAFQGIDLTLRQQCCLGKPGPLFFSPRMRPSFYVAPGYLFVTFGAIRISLVSVWRWAVSGQFRVS